MKHLFAGAFAILCLLGGPQAARAQEQGAPGVLHPTLDFHSPQAQANLLGIPLTFVAPSPNADWLLSRRPTGKIQGVAFFVNGWANADAILVPDKTGAADADVYGWFADHGIDFRICWWNSLERHRLESPGAFPSPFTDDQFVEDLVREITRIPCDQKVFLIGHSFGADSLLKVARRIKRPVELLAVLDATGTGGRRVRGSRGNVYAEQVKHLWNRWQRQSPWPVDFRTSGDLATTLPATSQSQREVDNLKEPAHSYIHKDEQVQRALVEYLGCLSRTWSNPSPPKGAGP